MHNNMTCQVGTSSTHLERVSIGSSAMNQRYDLCLLQAGLVLLKDANGLHLLLAMNLFHSLQLPLFLDPFLAFCDLALYNITNTFMFNNDKKK